MERLAAQSLISAGSEQVDIDWCVGAGMVVAGVVEFRTSWRQYYIRHVRWLVGLPNATMWVVAGMTNGMVHSTQVWQVSFVYVADYRSFLRHSVQQGFAVVESTIHDRARQSIGHIFVNFELLLLARHNYFLKRLLLFITVSWFWLV